MALWENPNDEAVKVEYGFELDPPAAAQGLVAQDYIPLAILAAAAVVLGVLLWRARRTRPAETESDE